MGIEKLHLEDALEDSPQVNQAWISFQKATEVKWEGCPRVEGASSGIFTTGTTNIDLQSQFIILPL